jgi:hypothetical protein
MRLSSMTKTYDHLLYLNVTVEFDSLDSVDSDPLSFGNSQRESLDAAIIQSHKLAVLELDHGRWIGLKPQTCEPVRKQHTCKSFSSIMINTSKPDCTNLIYSRISHKPSATVS